MLIFLPEKICLQHNWLMMLKMYCISMIVLIIYQLFVHCQLKVMFIVMFVIQLIKSLFILILSTRKSSDFQSKNNNLTNINHNLVIMVHATVLFIIPASCPALSDSSVIVDFILVVHLEEFANAWPHIFKYSESKIPKIYMEYNANKLIA